MITGNENDWKLENQFEWFTLGKLVLMIFISVARKKLVDVDAEGFLSQLSAIHKGEREFLAKFSKIIQSPAL